MIDGQPRICASTPKPSSRQESCTEFSCSGNFNGLSINDVTKKGCQIQGHALSRAALRQLGFGVWSKNRIRT